MALQPPQPPPRVPSGRPPSLPGKPPKGFQEKESHGELGRELARKIYYWNIRASSDAKKGLDYLQTLGAAEVQQGIELAQKKSEGFLFQDERRANYTLKYDRSTNTFVVEKRGYSGTGERLPY